MFDNLKLKLGEYGEGFVKELRNQLRNAGSYPGGKYASGSLDKSINSKVKESNNNFEIQIGGNEYFWRIEYGTLKGVKDSNLFKNIQEWCPLKGIPVEAAGPITGKIYREGIPATPTLQQTITNNNIFIDELSMALRKDVDGYITKKLI